MTRSILIDTGGMNTDRTAYQSDADDTATAPPAVTALECLHTDLSKAAGIVFDLRLLKREYCPDLLFGRLKI
jgi:hypothetical protein